MILIDAQSFTPEVSVQHFFRNTNFVAYRLVSQMCAFEWFFHALESILDIILYDCNFMYVCFNKTFIPSKTKQKKKLGVLLMLMR